MSTILLRKAEVDGVLVDVRIVDATVAVIGSPGSLGGAETEVDCSGGALIPGLHDHHLHLLSMAAALESIDVATDLKQRLRIAHQEAPVGNWVRAVNYEEATGGVLDRWELDSVAPGRPIRVQHRSGALWVLSSAALDLVGALDSAEAGIERDHLKQPTGRIFRLDDWLRRRLPDVGPQHLASVGHRLAGFGVTGVTDCTPTVNRKYFETVARAVHAGALPLTVAVTGGPELTNLEVPDPLRRGPVKIVISDHVFPELDILKRWIKHAHRVGRPVAVHCVTRAALFLALAAWEESGSWPGDRIEHASVVPLEVAHRLAELAISVVTQPAFILDRGDDYLKDVEPEDHPDLYRCASLIRAGIKVGGSTDAPFGPDDPWVAIRSAMDRRSALGRPVGADLPLDAISSLELFLAPLDAPGGWARRIRVGEPADLCLCDAPLHQILIDPHHRHVALTIATGTVTFWA